MDMEYEMRLNSLRATESIKYYTGYISQLSLIILGLGKLF